MNLVVSFLVVLAAVAAALAMHNPEVIPQEHLKFGFNEGYGDYRSYRGYEGYGDIGGHRGGAYYRR